MKLLGLNNNEGVELEKWGAQGDVRAISIKSAFHFYFRGDIH